MTEQLQHTELEKDDLANDLLKMVANAGLLDNQQQKLLMELLPYIVQRDNKIFNHAYQVGRASVWKIKVF